MLCSFCGGKNFTKHKGRVECDRCGSLVYHEDMVKKSDSKNHYGHLSEDDIEALNICKEYNL